MAQLARSCICYVEVPDTHGCTIIAWKFHRSATEVSLSANGAMRFFQGPNGITYSPTKYWYTGTVDTRGILSVSSFCNIRGGNVRRTEARINALHCSVAPIAQNILPTFLFVVRLPTNERSMSSGGQD